MGLGGAKPAGASLETNVKLTSTEYESFVKNNEATEDKLLTDVGSYQRLIGRLLYLTMTRVDIAFVVQVLSQFMHKSKHSHMEAVIRVVRYIKVAHGLGLLMSAQGSNKLQAFCDSDWG
ncbi:uncharacterized mitochondrial protein AtMg00240-like [Nicotiana sylvestris]|uniref:uncharacterized mitochondrial protein AtMg00240-like n=1 Tax=Nicotiana sylvestris TaxID=4096 RepID=UPI00388C9AFB